MTRTIASILAALLASGCAGAPRPMQLRRVTLYQNGIGYFERTGVLGGKTLRLELARPELDDVLKTLTVIDRQGAGVATVEVPNANENVKTIAIDIKMAAGRAHDLHVGYAVPTPAWKAAYRVVLDDSPKSGALLQAWAMVHNTTREDWSGVQLTLGTGAPMSFVQDMTKPQYVSRPDVTGRMVQPTVLGPIGNENATAVDNDRDGILDVDDKCPDEGEAYNGAFDEDGCPDLGHVIVRDTAIEIMHSIQFAANSETIALASQPLIDAVAQAMLAHPDLQLVEIGGHTSSDESDGWALSARRATAVRDALVARGVAATRLEIQPYAAVQPVATADTPAGREKNRRASFTIKKRSGNDAPARAASRRLPIVDAAAMQSSTHTRTTPTGVAGSVRYVLTDPVTIGRGKSTMVSILNKPITGEDVLLFRPDGNAPGSATHPFRAARLVNTSGFTLESGPIAIFSGGTFVGDSILERLGVDETSWIPYAVDGGTTVTRTSAPDERPIRLVAMNRGVLTVENAGILTTTYTINAGRDATRTIYIRHPKTARYTPRDLPPRTIEQTDAYLVPVPLTSAKTSTLVIEEREPRQATIEIVRADDATIAAYIEGAKLPAPIVERIETAASLRRDMAALEEDARKIRGRIADISQRAIELRDSLRAIDKVRGADDLRKKLLAGLEKTTAESDALARSLGEKTEALATARARLADAIRDLTTE
ncbi:MAG: OmpA family protein [Kofleriaceae bacterium]